MGAAHGRVALVTVARWASGRGSCAASWPRVPRSRSPAEELCRRGGRARGGSHRRGRPGDRDDHGRVTVADAEAAVAAALSAFGRLDVLVNNAGIQPIDQYKPLHLMPEEVWTASWT